MSISKKIFGRMPDGTEIYLFSLRNSNGMQVDIINYGGIIVNMLVPGRDGRTDDITLGHEIFRAILTGVFILALL
jgi:aldose 1-epimerase